MMLQVRPTTTLGEAIRAYCTAVLEEVGEAYPDFEIQESGEASVKLLIPGEYGFHYLYFGLNSKGYLEAELLKDMAPGRPQAILAPIMPAKAVTLKVALMAQKLRVALNTHGL